MTSSKKSLFIRTTPEQHRIAEELLKMRAEKSLSKMMVALILEEHERQTSEQNRRILVNSMQR